MPVRYFLPEMFEVLRDDIAFLAEKIRKSGFEYDLQIRDNYFNLYYRGNSIGKVECRAGGTGYIVTVHEKFVDDAMLKRFDRPRTKPYVRFSFGRDLRAFFSDKHLGIMTKNVEKVNYKEELAFQQLFMTANRGRQDFIIIDTQIADGDARPDMLALRQTHGTDYEFCAVEVKLGNNPALKGDVGEQLDGYVTCITKNFEDYCDCYKRNLCQKQELGLIEGIGPISIVRPVRGVVVVIGYPGLAQAAIGELHGRHPEIEVVNLNEGLRIYLPATV